MATFSGRDGLVGIGSGGQALNVRSWTLTETSGIAQGHHSDCTDYWGVAKPGKKNFNGSFDFYQDDTALQPEQGSGSTMLTGGEKLVFSFSDNNFTYAGTLVITEIAYTNDIEGGELVSGSCSFVGDAALNVA